VPLLDKGKLRGLKDVRLTHAGTARLGIGAYRLGAGASHWALVSLIKLLAFKEFTAW
jgi:hypothetical protein